MMFYEFCLFQSSNLSAGPIIAVCIVIIFGADFDWRFSFLTTFIVIWSISYMLIATPNKYSINTHLKNLDTESKREEEG